jgi:hypothetical protein
MAKPKAKTEEQKNAELEMMLSEAATSNHLASPAATRADEGTSSTLVEDSPAPQQQGPATTSGNEEQKGEKVSPAPVAEPLATPTPEVVATPVVAPNPATPVAAPKPTQRADPNSEKEVVAETPAETSSTLDEELGLGGLFAPSSEKKTAHCRITNTHYQYFQLLGTLVGDGTSIPDIVHNIIADFIKKNDSKMQKAIQKGMRRRQAALNTNNKS